MQLYAVTIRATVIKTITLAADSHAEANEAAHEIFTVEPELVEAYEQETQTIELVEA